MIPHVKDCYFLSRENNVIYANLTNGGKIPLVRLHQKFIDLVILDREPLEYMERYIEMFPHLIEIIEPKPITKQFELF